MTLFNSCGVGYNHLTYVPDYLAGINYWPFTEKNKLAVLGEESRLKLTSNFPIVDGATALYPLYSAFVQAVYSEEEYLSFITYYENNIRFVRTEQIVNVNGTSKAFDNLIDGQVDIIFCAAPSENQVEIAREKGVTFNMTPIGKEAFVFFVNKRNPVSNLTMEQIKGIYSGRITNWNELGGRNKEIMAYQRRKDSGSQTMLELIMGDELIMEPLVNIKIDMMNRMITRVVEYRNGNNAIGYSFLFYTTQMVRTKQIRNNRISLLSINGINPSIETIQSGTYPYSEYFYAITTNTENENVNLFIDWILSEQGQYLVRETGYVPIN
jgi:phosphate transport system substrate-binding protein